MKETHIIFRTALPAWALLAIAAAFVLLAVLAYRRTTRPVTRRWKIAFIVLRLVALGALFTCILRPALETTTYTVEKRPLIFLMDESRSMSEIRDTPDGASRLETIRKELAENEDVLSSLRERYDIITLGFARELLGAGEHDEFATNYNAYGRALEDALKQAAAGQCDGIVLLGDGSHNLSPPDPMDVAASIAERGIPLYTVGVGREEIGRRICDIKIANLDVPRSAYVFSSLPVRARVLFRGCRGITAKVRLEFPNQPLQFQTVQVAHDEEIVPVQFEVTPQEAGEFKLTVRAEEVPGEILTENNVRSAFLRVTTSGLRVGYFDCLRPESKFIYQALRGAKQLNVFRIVVASREKISQTPVQWDRYDVIIIGDITAISFVPEDLEAIKKLVQTQPKGLILLGGRQSLGDVGFRGTTLEDVLPVELARNWQYTSALASWQVEPAAIAHPILALAETEVASAQHWKAMPPLTAVAVGLKPRRGAEVLARDQNGNPLLCVQRVGVGRVACVLSDTTFRWFFTDQAPTQDDFRRFWRQLVLWAGGIDSEHEQKFWISLTKNQVSVGEALQVEAHLLAPDGSPIRDARLKLKVQTPKGTSADLQSLFSREQGMFQAQYAPPEAGEYMVRAEAERGGKVVGTDAAFFQAFSADRELEDPVADLSLLRRLSDATSGAGGKYYQHTQIRGLLEDLKEKGKPLRLAVSKWRDIWDTPMLFCAFLIAIAAEWGLRRWLGLI